MQSEGHLFCFTVLFLSLLIASVKEGEDYVIAWVYLLICQSVRNTRPTQKVTGGFG